MPHVRLFATPLLVMIFLLPACSDPGGADVDAGPDAGPWGFEDLVVEWETCSLHDGQDDGRAECATVQMPLRWEEETDETFGTYAKRLLADGEAEAQLWLLHGGPGGSGTVGLPSMMEAMQTDYPELDVYTLDARGTGWSEWLGCPEQEASTSDQGSWVSPDELDACIEHVQATYGDRLDMYNPTHASIDLAALIHHTREDGKKVLIWGGSGGTFWAQRYLQFFPGQADGVILEGIVPPDESLVFQDEYTDLIGRRLLEMCSADPLCSSKLPDPEATVRDLVAKLDDGHCAELGVDAATFMALVYNFDFYYPTNSFMPAFVYRMDRCDPDDMNAIYNLYMMMFGQPEQEHSFSTVLFFNEGYSELWEHSWFEDNDALLAYLDGVHEDGLFVFGMGYDRNDYFLRWPRYSDPHDDTWAESDVPMLMLQGQLDPSTPHDFAITVGEHFDGPHQNWASFPYGAHNVSNGTPVEEDIEAMHCGQRLFVDFMKDPSGDLDMSCIDETLPLDFEGRAWAPYLLGTEDFFENVPADRVPLALPPRLEHTLIQLRQRWRATYRPR